MKKNEQHQNLRGGNAFGDDQHECGRAFKGTRRKLIDSSLLVIEHTRQSLRFACVERASNSHVDLLWLRSIESADLAVAMTSLRGSVNVRPTCAVVISSEVAPAVHYDAVHRPMYGGTFRPARNTREQSHAILELGPQPNDMAIGWVGEDTASELFDRRWVIARVPRSTRLQWIEGLRQFGIELAGLYPLAGCPIAAMDREATRSPTLCLQIERDLTAVMETDRGGCRAIQVHHAPPSLRQCMDLVGDGCPEVLLFGGGDGLRPLGLELALSGTTWVRFLKPAGTEDGEGSGSEALGSIVGAARHAFGIAPADAIACVPAVD